MVDFKELYTKIKSNKYIMGILAFAVLIILYVFLVTSDVKAALQRSDVAYGLVIILLVFAVVFLWFQPKPETLPDPIEIFKIACQTCNTFIKNGIVFEDIDKKSMHIESGMNCYYYEFDLARTFIKKYAIIKFNPSVFVSDLVSNPWSATEKRRKMGLEWSIEEIKTTIEKKNVMDQVLKDF